MNVLHVCNLKQTTRKKRHDCVWDPVTNKKTSQLRGVNYSRKKSGKMFVTGPYNAKEALMITGAWRPTLPSCVSKLLGERDSVTVVCGSPHDHTIRTQSERLLNYAIKIHETQPRFRNKRPASVIVIGVYHMTTLCTCSTDHRWDLFASKKTPCQPNSCAKILLTSWWNGVHHGTRQRKRNDDNH